MPVRFVLPCLSFFTLLLASALAADPHAAGRALYVKHCASCHGEQGEGVADRADDPLTGDKPVPELAGQIDRTMPKKKANSVDAEQSQLIAAYIYDAFYSPEAQAKVRPAKIAFSRLTVRQHQHSLADLLATFRHRDDITEVGGLDGHYTSPNPKLKAEPVEGEDRRKRVNLKRRDAQLHFTWGQASPMPGELEAEQFNVEWNGCFYAEETGVHEFILRTENGVRAFINDQEEHKLIDGWVSTGTMTDHQGSLFLLGGRWYPIKIQFFKYKDKSASLSFEWKPPHRPREVVPARLLTHRYTKELFVPATPFPPDDSSAGYARGVAVSKGWDEAATGAAIETADFIVSRFDGFTRSKPGQPDREAKTRAFLRDFASRAFRRPISDEDQRFYIDSRFTPGRSPESATREALLLMLKSPRFLYPELGPRDDWKIASRIALTLWDSMPSQALIKAAERGQLHDPKRLRQLVQDAVQDQRTLAKAHAFFHHWLHLDRAEDLAKDSSAYPGFDAALAADLHQSLQLFLDDLILADGPTYKKLLLSGDVFMSQRMASFYGSAWPGGEAEFQRIAFDPRERSGVLTHPLLLSAFAYFKSSSPIHRGVFLTRNVLGRSLKPPVTAIQFMDETFDPTLTMREKVTQLTQSANCMGCHGTINPLGFALEAFDGAGRRRQTDNHKPIDTSADYRTSSGKVIRLTGPRDIAEHAANSPEAQRAFIEQLFHALVKQPIRAYGPTVLDDLHGQFTASGFNIRQLITEITLVAVMK